MFPFHFLVISRFLVCEFGTHTNKIQLLHALQLILYIYISLFVTKTGLITSDNNINFRSDDSYSIYINWWDFNTPAYIPVLDVWCNTNRYNAGTSFGGCSGGAFPPLILTNSDFWCFCLQNVVVFIFCPPGNRSKLCRPLEKNWNDVHGITFLIVMIKLY